MKKLKTQENIESYYSKNIYVESAETLIPEVIKRIKELGVRHLPIVSVDSQPIGIISDRDLKVFTSDEFAQKFTARDIMTKAPICVSESFLLREACHLMIKERVSSLLVINEQNKIKGIFTTEDALRALQQVFGESEDSMNPSDQLNLAY